MKRKIREIGDTEYVLLGTLDECT